MKKTEETAGIGEITEEETTAVVGETETAGTTGTEDAAVVPGRDNNGRVWNRQDKAR